MCISLESTEQQAVLMLLFEHYSHKFLDKILQEVPQDYLSGTAPSCLPSHLPDVMHMTLQAFPLHFCVLQAIKNWRWEQPGNEASVSGLRSIFLVMCTIAVFAFCLILESCKHQADRKFVRVSGSAENSTDFARFSN